MKAPAGGVTRPINAVCTGSLRNDAGGIGVTVSLENAVAAHLDAWNAPDSPDRAQAIANLYSPDVFIGEPGAEHRGLSGMATAISALQAQMPGTEITRTGPIQTVQDLVTYTWELGARGEPPIATGRDVLLMRDGRITSLYVLIDAPKPFAD